ncbi:MAG: TRAP transporter substrate-binding protein [Moorellales bacterium]
MEPIVLKMAVTYSQNHPSGIADLAWIEKTEKETGGRVKIEPYWGGALAKLDQAYTEVANGVVDIAEIQATYVKEGFDIDKAMRIFFWNVSDAKLARRIYNELRSKFPEIDAEFSGVKVLERNSLPPYQLLMAKKPVRKIQDFKGVTLKASGDHPKIVTALGGDAASIPMGETYIAMEKGTVDGCIAPLETLDSFKFYEVVKYVTLLNLGSACEPHRAMNLETWNRLPDDVKGVLEENIEWWGEKCDEELARVDQAGLDLAKQHGIELIELSGDELAKFQEVVDELAREQAAKLDAKGLPGTAIYEEVQRLVKEYGK